MNRIKISIALVTVFGLMLSTVGVANAKTATLRNHAKVSHSINLTQHQVKHQTINTKAVPAKAKQSAKTTALKTAKSQTKHTVKKTAIKTAKAHAKLTTKPVIKQI